MSTRTREPRRTLDRSRYDTVGFDRLPAFVDPAVGHRMLDDVVEIARASSAGEEVDALVMPEFQDGFADGRAQRLGRDARPEDVVSKIFKLHRRPAFASFVRSPAVSDILIELLGPDVDCFLSQFIFKNPGAWGQPWHQDSFYFPFDPARPICGIWLAVTEATLENGCLHVLPGSQVEPVHEHVPDRRPNANLGYVEIVDHDMAKSEPVLMDPGDLLVFDSHLMHRSTDNDSSDIRAAMVFHFCQAGTADDTEAQMGYVSPVNDFTPLLRDGRSIPATG